MRTGITIACMLLGAGFMLLSAVGLLRFPDLFTRMQAATKASTLGIVFMMVAAATHFGTLGVIVRALLVIVFLFLTAPVAAHVMGRAAYRMKVQLWSGTAFDDLRDRYVPGGGVLSEAREVGPQETGVGRRPGQHG